MATVLLQGYIQCRLIDINKLILVLPARRNAVFATTSVTRDVRQNEVAVRRGILFMSPSFGSSFSFHSFGCSPLEGDCIYVLSRLNDDGSYVDVCIKVNVIGL